MLGEKDEQITPRLKQAACLAKAALKPTLTRQVISYLWPHYAWARAAIGAYLKAGSFKAFVSSPRPSGNLTWPCASVSPYVPGAWQTCAACSPTTAPIMAFILAGLGAATLSENPICTLSSLPGLLVDDSWRMPGFASLISLAAMVLLLLPRLLYRIRIEEKLLVDGFGGEYRAYIHKTRRLIPWIW